MMCYGLYTVLCKSYWKTVFVFTIKIIISISFHRSTSDGSLTDNHSGSFSPTSVQDSGQWSGNLTTSTPSDLPDDLVDIEPTNFNSDIDIPSYFPVSVQVEFLKLENRIFEKRQTRTGKIARQRIIDGKVQWLFLQNNFLPLKDTNI